LLLHVGFYLNTFFEILQKYDSITNVIPDWFNIFPFLENSKIYFINGTFDIFDVFSIILGAVLGFLTLITIDRLSIEQKKEK